ncbi:hypothetical protein SCHPADRAFT_841891 [Schizopora paradoxa]|uniref:Rhodanese domain-containing protein n=1 Tax=Schizopora paradoxa TaxID=27342 RepID=A0A0H2SA08_9AGAM|nr:hypothetical protein SCHPADRAFT_841891 [Schizopora paradoxa]
MDMDQVPGSLNDGGQNCSFKEWHDAFPQPKSSPPSISADELAVLLKTKTVGKDFVVVDVRRTDFEDWCIPGAINLPAHSFYPTLQGAVALLQSVPLVIFHCNSCGKPSSRGRRVAGWYQDYLDEKGITTSSARYLEGGIKGWASQWKGKEEGMLLKL